MAKTETRGKSAEEQRLKYLEFVQIAALRAVTYSEKLYGYAKENSGPLKPGVDCVEGTVKTVVGPVYDKYQGIPVDVLKFLDRKVDESVSKVQSRQVSTQAFETAQRAPAAAARAVMSKVRNAAVVEKAKTMYDKYEPATKDIYSKYEPMAEKYAASAVRAARYCSHKYDRAVQKAAEKGIK